MGIPRKFSPAKLSPFTVRVFVNIVFLFTGINKNGHPTKNGDPNQSAAKITAPPTEGKCDMKTMYKCVVSKLTPYWTTVGDYLEYSVRERNNFKGADNKRSLVAVLENWIGTNNGRQPKTWSTFTTVLMELDQDLGISVGSEICASLGVFTSGKLLIIVHSYVISISEL